MGIRQKLEGGEQAMIIGGGCEGPGENGAGGGGGRERGAKRLKRSRGQRYKKRQSQRKKGHLLRNAGSPKKKERVGKPASAEWGKVGEVGTPGAGQQLHLPKDQLRNFTA